MTAMLPIVELIECPQRREPTPPGPCAMVVFGASGDLTARLLIPALYNLSRTRLIPENFALIGVARSEETSESWRDHLHEKLESYAGKASEFNGGRIDDEAWSRLADKMSYVQGDLSKPELYDKLRAALAEAEKIHGTQGNVIFYLAVAEQFFCPAIEHLREAKLTEQLIGEDGKPRYWRRVVFEKPFGHSLESARALNTRVLRTLNEDQIFRIDHFLGKETVQNIMALRFANGMFEPIWNRDRIDHVQDDRGGDGRRGEPRQHSMRRQARFAIWCPIMSWRLFPWSRWSRPQLSTRPPSGRGRPMSSRRCAL